MTRTHARCVEIVHGSCVALNGAAVLFRGPPGLGKSDLALRLIDGGARLVADDQVVLNAAGGRVRASAPPAIQGLIEVRGIGILRVPWVAEGWLAAVFDLVADGGEPRLPEERRACDCAGVAVPLFVLWPFAVSAAAKVRLVAMGGVPHE